MVFETLNKLKWKSGLNECVITILHRGAPDDRKVVEGSCVTELKKSYFSYEKDGRESTIPLHRVLEVKVRNDVIWRRKAGRG
jgi:uncharacterized protein (UPF0248 family)